MLGGALRVLGDRQRCYLHRRLLLFPLGSPGLRANLCRTRQGYLIFRLCGFELCGSCSSFLPSSGFSAPLSLSVTLEQMPHQQVPRPGLWQLVHNGKIELRPLRPSEVTFSSSLVVGSLAASWIPDSDDCFIDRSLIALTFRMETLGELSGTPGSPDPKEISAHGSVHLYSRLFEFALGSRGLKSCPTKVVPLY